MTQFRVTMVDVNDVPFYVFVEAELPEDAFNTAEFENKFCSSVEVAEYVERHDLDAGSWEVVYFPGDDELDEDPEYGFEGEHGELSDIEADADTLRNCGWGTDEDYGYYGEEYV